ncbi:tetratricopeptide repeat protein [Alicyclobacillus fastidiosus]|uniref:Tetratricopeptide repeat protein n=2 Tax=Alicyclobacillus fastidiosus TaxID=392011 RepID=A0ABV5AM56_9BACL|nr:hypothetical protein [Alicyclobacillus fastidiosus]WEH08427.1 hypothetical protein PYS47_17260 [Alicyclobacillus fastidiosus]
MKISQFSPPKFTIVSLSLLAIVTLRGCAKSPQDLNVATHNALNSLEPSPTSSASDQIVSIMHISKAVLQEYQKKAAKEPNNYQAQIRAAIGYHVQGNDGQAIIYYKKAIQISLESGEAYNDIGNIYFRDKHKP